MNKSLNATCRLCGAKYHRCDHCDELKHVLTSWKMVSDTEEHYKIFCILRNYNLGKIKKEEAAKQLSACDLSDVQNWTIEGNKTLIKELMQAPKMTFNKKKVEKVEKAEKVEEVNENENKEVEVTTEEK